MGRPVLESFFAFKVGLLMLFKQVVSKVFQRPFEGLLEAFESLENLHLFGAPVPGALFRRGEGCPRRGLWSVPFLILILKCLSKFSKLSLKVFKRPLQRPLISLLEAF